MYKIFVKPLNRKKILWIYKNEIQSNLEKIDPGSIVKVYETKTNRLIGTGYLNPHSIISIRLLSFKDENPDEEFFKKRILRSLKYREEFLGLKDNYRLIFSESDFMPGLIVDKYNKCVVVQISTLGMEKFKELIIKILDEILSPEIIILKSDSSARIKEGLEIERKIVKGQLTELPIIQENDAKFIIDPIHGQKTGFFLDQRDNRLFLKEVIKAGEGLDLFSYIGAWSIHLAKKGIRVTGVDSSERAVEIYRKNAKINNVSEKCKIMKADVFDFLKWEAKKQRKYEFIIVDPPAFVKSSAEKKDGLRGYLTLNTMAIKLLKKNGILATSSCSQHVSESEFKEMIKETLIINNKNGILIYSGTQSKDHPILLSMPETAYLKCLIIKVS